MCSLPVSISPDLLCLRVEALTAGGVFNSVQFLSPRFSVAELSSEVES